MKNILAITYCFPPIFVPATMRCIKLVKGLAEQEYKITVLSVAPDSFRSSSRDFKKLDPGLYQIVPAGIINKTVWSFENNPFFRLIKRFKILHQLYEPFKMEWYYPATRYAKKIKDYDILFSCSKPDSCHLIGYYLKKTTGKPWVAYFSDPWIDNPYITWQSKKIYEHNLKLENRVISSADRILFTTEKTRDLVMKKYPDHFFKKTGIVPHSFVPEWYNLTNGREFDKKGKKIRVVHTGHFYGPRTPQPLFDALIKLKKEISNIPGKIEFLFVGEMDQKYRRFIHENKLEGIITISDTVPYVNSLGLIKNADYLLLIDAPLTSTKESIFLPSKLIDYIGTYNRVIGITPEKGESANVLENTCNLVWDVHDNECIYRNLKYLINGDLVFKPKEDRINKYHYKNVARDLSGIIKQAEG